MQNLEKYLINLMHQHDCVVIPNFGGLVANYTPGFADAENHLLQPPKKGFVWNKFLQHNDGLLAHEICKEENVSYEIAITQLNEQIAVFKKQLQTTRRLDFDTIGSFYLTDENLVNFHPKKDNYLVSSFGLPIVKAIPLAPLMKEVEKQEEPVRTLTPVIEKVNPEKESGKGKVISISEPPVTIVKKSNTKWWVAAALIPIGFYSAWIPMKTDLLNPNGSFQYSDLNPFSYSKTVGVYESFEINFSKVDSLPDINFSVFEMEKSYNSVENTFIEEPESTYVDIVVPAITYTPKTNETAYFVIGGCFSDKANAEVFIQDLKSKGFDAQLVDFHKGLHRVAFGKYKSNEAAKSAKTTITSSGEFSAWVLKK